MNGIAVLSLLVFIASFLGITAYDALASSDKFYYTPPYFFRIGDWIAIIVSFSFVFIFSLLFFGLGAPAAMAVEGLKYGTLFSSGHVTVVGLLYIFPQMLAMISATTLGEGIMKDWEGKSTVFNYWSDGLRFFFMGIALLAALAVLQSAYPAVFA